MAGGCWLGLARPWSERRRGAVAGGETICKVLSGPPPPSVRPSYMGRSYIALLAHKYMYLAGRGAQLPQSTNIPSRHNGRSPTSLSACHAAVHLHAARHIPPLHSRSEPVSAACTMRWAPPTASHPPSRFRTLRHTATERHRNPHGCAELGYTPRLRLSGQSAVESSVLSSCLSGRQTLSKEGVSRPAGVARHHGQHRARIRANHVHSRGPAGAATAAAARCYDCPGTCHTLNRSCAPLSSYGICSSDAFCGTF